jgi:hypothetical protein
VAQQPLNPAQKGALNEALNIAIGAKDIDMMTSAVDAGADANILLFRGIEKTEITWVKAAVDHGADVHSSMAGISYGNVLREKTAYPAFFWLTRNFDEDIGKYLLSRGADIDAPSPDDDTALMAAVKMEQKKPIRFLVDNGANPLRLCADQKFPLKELEDSRSYDGTVRLSLIKAMMENLKQKAPGPAPANDTAAAATAQDIEVSRPLELKLKPKPKAAFEL